MENLDFSEDEIQQQLEALGYNNIPRHRLHLDELIRHEKSKSHSSSKITVRVLIQEYDSYTQHSVAPKYQLPSTALNRLEVDPDLTDLQQLSFAVSQSSTPDRDTGEHGRPLIKRKVLRCGKFTSGGFVKTIMITFAAFGPGERLGGINVSMSTHQELELESDEAGSLSDRSESDRLPSAFKAYIRGMVGTLSLMSALAVIRPVKDHPHTKNLKKTDPVAKYFQYKQDWEMFKAPGEKDRKALHWEIREQLAYQPLPPKPRRVFVPNTYVVPTEKKRSALRWEIRHDLANGLLPPINYRL
uniref:HYLS1 centriolar and ciliogenesis associated n=1 Tax=Oncorhynchus kisutch TaxID=8019 RepID=A0A8C7D3K0_ONCKI